MESVTGRVALFAIAILATLSHALEFPEYTFKNHPFYSLKQFENTKPPAPVIMKKYYRLVNGVTTSRGGLFAPESANYDTFKEKTPFARNLDALHVMSSKLPKSGGDNAFLTVHLNDEARVFVLLVGPGINGKVLGDIHTVDGLGTEWNGMKALRSATGSSIPVGDPDRHGTRLTLPFRAAVMETTVQKGAVLSVPHPKFISVNGITVARYVLLFARPDSRAPTSMPQAIEYPRAPRKLKMPITGIEVETDQVMPNRLCPTWLHDMYVTKSRESEAITEELQDLPYWRTWHPMIDPIFWCYFNHEHGSYPGLHLPMLGYTAWKTFDPNGRFMNRQDESHEGFKVYSFPLHDQERFVVIVVHMHLAFARRFTARHHTTTVAVLDKEWNLELEFHMKMDFGAGKVTLRNRKDIGVDNHENGIIKSLAKRKIIAGRRFNVLNVDENYPDSVDTRFRFNCNRTPKPGNQKQILRGIYEQWEGPLNTCSGTSEKMNRGFKFDVRNPSSALRFLEGTTDENMQILSGDNVDKFLAISKASGTVEIGIEHCHFDLFRSETGISLERTGGIFYTDPYFSAILKTHGKNAVRQFIKPEFATVKIKPGKITPVDQWNGHMDYQTDKKEKGRKFRNTENAVNKYIN